MTRAAPHYVWPVISDKTRDAVLAQLGESISIYNRSGTIEKLERALEKKFGVRHALLFNSGTAALHASYAALGLGPGDEVIVPAYTFFATASPLFATGAQPVLADADASGNLSVEDVAAAVTPRTRAVAVTHMWGIPADVEALRRFCDGAGLKLVEDISHAYGATSSGRLVGSFGDLAALSLQGQKTLTGGEGGVLLTDNDELFYRALAVGHYNKRCVSEIPEHHALRDIAVTGLGLKLRIHPLAAAIALQQLNEVDGYLTVRRSIAAEISRALADVPGIQLVPVRAGDAPSWYAYPFLLDASLSTVADKIHAALQAEGAMEFDRPKSTAPLGSYPLFSATHKWHAGYREAAVRPCPAADDFYRRALKMPVWHFPADLDLALQYAEAVRKVIPRFL